MKEWLLRVRSDEVRRRASAVGKAIALSPLVAFGVVFMVIVPGGMALWAVRWVFDTGLLALEVLVVTALMVATLGAFYWSVLYGGIASQRPLGRFEPTVYAAAIAFFAVASFTGLTLLLHDEGLVGITPDPADDRALDETMTFYVWHLANTLPLVDIPGNLDWEKPFEFDDRLGGLLVVLFTGFVIFPLIQLARLILADRDLPFDVTVVQTLRKHVGAKRIFIRRDRSGYGRALVDGDLVVDVMQAVWNHDAATRRLRRASAGTAERRPGGYLLVVDAIADAARERIGQALFEAPFEGTLAVWRADQPAKDLTDELDALRERLDQQASPT
ncbi:MAG TPA: hypothetical protein VFX80_01660 [Solirubrobacteraceae bacterium]|nr:hypothetical protein [Solirubrobacteraceae bacterium]